MNSTVQGPAPSRHLCFPDRLRHSSLLLWILLFGLPLVPNRAFALNPEFTVYQYNARTWHRSNGLPSDAVNAIAQTSDGHVWLGTSRGLVDFDGMEFHVVGLPGQEESRPQLIAGLERRPAGGLWVGIERGGFGYFDENRFVAMHVKGLESEFPTTRVVHESREGQLFLSFVGKAGRLLPAGQVEYFTPDTDVQCMYEDSHGRIWMGTTTRGLQYWEKGRLTTVSGQAESLWRGYVISSVVVDNEGLIWVGASNGLHCLNPDLSPRPPTGITPQPRAMLMDSHGVLWVGTISGGLVRYKDGVTSVLGRRDGLASDRILALAESNDGSLWVGTEDGLSQLSDVKFPIVSVSEGLAAEACLTVAASPEGGLWAGTSNGLSLIRNGKCTNYGVDKADGFKSEWIRRIHAARNGDVYFLDGQLELCRFRAGRVDKTWPTETWPHGLAENADGIVLGVGTALMRLDRDELVPYRLADGSAVQLGYINEVLRASDDSLWVASKTGVVQIKAGKLHDWGHDLNPSDPAFYYLCEDDQGAVWAARNSGLVRFKDGQLRTVDHKQGLQEDLVYAIAGDQAGNFWMDSPAGIFRVNQRELNAVADGTAPRVQCVLYDGQHVVKTADKSTREYSICRSNDGQIWLPSSKGVIRIDPARVPVNTQPPPVYLQRILVDGREYSVKGEPALVPGQGNLEFDYAALDFQAPSRVRYRYRLAGYQTNWVEAGGRRSAFFTNLSPGRYRFQVQACNADGVWSTAETAFPFSLPHRFYETVWFRLGVACAIIALIGLAWWTGERRRRREFTEIQKREQLQRQLIDSSPVAMVMLENRGRVLHANATFTRLFGYTAEEIQDIKAWWRSVCADPDAREDLLRNSANPTGIATNPETPVRPLETTITCKDGTLRTVVRTRTDMGERTLVVFSDLTDRKRAEDERRSLEEQLRQGQKMEAIGRLSGGVAHDFNNLLTVILGNVGLVETLERLPSDLIEPLEDIKGAAQRAANLTRQLLAFSRKQPMSPARLDLNQVVSDLTRMLQRILGEDIRLEQQLSAQPVLVRADAGMLEQVLLNLVVNARDAMPSGGKLTVATALVEFGPETRPMKASRQISQYVQLSVTDTGYGIAPEVLPRIFEPFFTTKDIGKGTGLGLATAYGIIEQHEGWIEVSSQVGHGTVFHVYLPALSGAASVPGVRHGAALPPTASLRVILLVEDDTGVRSLVRKTLVAQGHRVLEAVSGPMALQVWQQHREIIDLLLTDVVMPDGMNGLELARVLLKEKPSLQVIYSSGYSADVAGGHFVGREGIDFLAKPFTPVALLKVVNRPAG